MDLFSTFALNRVIEELPSNPAFLLNMFFPMVESSTEETIMFDHVAGRRRIAPFVAHNVEGKVVDEIGFETFSFKPAYIKDKRTFDPEKQFKRRAGEKIGGSLTPEQRLAASVSWHLSDQLDIWTRRLEAMAAEALFSGKLTIVGEKYPLKVVDFLRDGRCRVVLTGGDKWSVAGVDPIDDMEEWAQTVYDVSKRKATDFVFTSDVWKVVRNKLGEKDANGHPTAAATLMKARFDLNTKNLDDMRAKLGPLVIAGEGARLVALFDEFRVWVYNDSHEEPDPAHPDEVGDEVPNLPPGSVLCLSRDVEGCRYFGAIKDLKAGLQARQYFVKSWEVEDPSSKIILGQSAPLLVPYRKNATLAATVL